MLKTAADKSEAIGWINNLRLLALFAVILLHTSAVLLAQYNKVSLTNWLTADVINAMVRFAVPVFVMITGALLLHRDYEITDFLKRRLGRIVIPFLFWSLVYIAYSYYNEEIVFSNDVWANVKLVLHQLKFGASYHLWYVYMLIGLYLFIPAISKFVRNASEKEILYFLLVWFLVMLANQSYLIRYKPQVELRYFEGYVGYLVLGHYLTFKQFKQKFIRAWAALLLLFAVAVIALGTYMTTKTVGSITTLFYEPVSPFVLLLSSSIFLMARFSGLVLNRRVELVSNFIGQYAYGIYLCHALFLYLLDDIGLSYKFCAPVLSIPLTAFCCLLLSTLLIFIINKIPIVGKYIGG